MLEYGIGALVTYAFLMAMVLNNGIYNMLSWKKVIGIVLTIVALSVLWPLLVLWMIWETIDSIRERKKIEQGKEYDN